MKNNMIRYVLIAILFLLLAILIGIFIFGLNHKINFENNIFMVKEKEYNLVDINKLIINANDADIEIKQADNDQLKVVQYSNAKNDKHLFADFKQDEAIEIKQNEAQINFDFLWHYNKFIIYIPASFDQELNLTNTSGKIEIRDRFTLKSLTVKSLSGKINFYEKITTDEMNINNRSGSINIEQIAGGLNLKTISGEINIQQFDISTNSHIESISGAIYIKFSKEARSQIEATSISGKIIYPDNKTNIGENPQSVLVINSISGRITLEK